MFKVGDRVIGNESCLFEWVHGKVGKVVNTYINGTGVAIAVIKFKGDVQPYRLIQSSVTLIYRDKNRGNNGC